MADRASHGLDDVHHGDATAPHGPSVRTYIIVFSALMVLLVITLGAAYFDLGAANLPIAMVIAVVKAGFVMAFFMHLKFSSRLVQFFALGALFWLAILFFLTFNDYGARQWLWDAHKQ